MKNQNFHINSFEIESSDILQYEFIGGFSKKILVVAPDSEDTAENKLLLKNILKSIEIEIAKDIHLGYLDTKKDVQVLNYLNEHKAKSIIAFGLKPSQLSFNINYFKYRITKINGLQIIFADSLSEISASKSLKKQLWESLKLLKF